MKFQNILEILSLNLCVLLAVGMPTEGPSPNSKPNPNPNEASNPASPQKNNDTDIFQGKRLIKIREDSPGVLMTPEEIWQLVLNNTGFLDITNQSNVESVKAAGRSLESFTPTEPRYQTLVKNLISSINPSRVEQQTRNLSEFYNRFFKTKSGAEAQNFIVDLANSSVISIRQKSHVKTSFVKFWPGPFFPTKNLIGRITGCDKALKNEVVIIGAHQDNVLKATPKDVRIPGADDNAAGSVVLLEVLKIISEMGKRFKRTIDFHWYAMKEMGRLGSLLTSEAFLMEKRNVKAVLNLDSIGYKESGGTDNNIAIYTDNSDNGLNQFLGGLVKEYLKYGWKNKSCGFACSDHASWYIRGFRAASVGELKDTPYMHTINDTIETVNFEQVVEFVKLSLAYIIELAEPYEDINEPSYCD